MFRRMRFVVAVSALLILLTAGAVQARPLNAPAPAAGLLTQVWQSLISSWAGVWAKDGVGLDPNGSKAHGPGLPSSAGKGHPSRLPAGR